MTLKEAAKEAIETKNNKMFTEVVEQISLKLGWNYEQIQQWCERQFGIDEDTFNVWLYSND